MNDEVAMINARFSSPDLDLDPHSIPTVDATTSSTTVSDTSANSQEPQTAAENEATTTSSSEITAKKFVSDSENGNLKLNAIIHQLNNDY
jgi:hypothetical protein